MFLGCGRVSSNGDAPIAVRTFYCTALQEERRRPACQLVVLAIPYCSGIYLPSILIRLLLSRSGWWWWWWWCRTIPPICTKGPRVVGRRRRRPTKVKRSTGAGVYGSKLLFRVQGKSGSVLLCEESKAVWM